MKKISDGCEAQVPIAGQMFRWLNPEYLNPEYLVEIRKISSK